MIIGGLIYLLWRSDEMIMFNCADAIGILPLIYDARVIFGGFSEYIPNIILFSLPDAVWVYSGTAFFSRLWLDESPVIHILWSSIFAALAVGSELGQLAGLVPGTFDIADLLLCIAAYVMAYKISTKF